MRTLRTLVAVLVAALLQSVAVSGNFQLDAQVVRVRDPVDDCGGGLDICVLYIDEMCLDPQFEEHLDPQFEETGSEEEEQDCSLTRFTNNVGLEGGLPSTTTLSVTNQPWPVDFHLRIVIFDNDLGNSDDYIETVVVLESLNTSSEFTEAMDYRNSNGRITLTMRFRVRCTGWYEGPHCDCLSHNDDINGHYNCQEEGGISCLPGYTNTSNFCRQQDYCVGVVCPSSGMCVSNPTFYTCEPPPPTFPTTPPPPSPTTPPSSSPTTPPSSSSPTTSDSLDNCNCPTGMSCMEEDGVYHCVCPEGFTGENCQTPDISTAAPRQQSGEEEEESGMSAAIIAAIVAGVLVALLLCAVVAVAIVCVALRKRRLSKLGAKANGSGTSMPTKISPSAAITSRVANPAYEYTGGENGSHSGDTLRDMPNPFYDYGRVDSNVDNPLYTGQPAQPQARDDIYSVPRSSPAPSSTSSQQGRGGGGGGGGGIYSIPKSPVEESGVYSTVEPTGGGGSASGNDAVAIKGNRYAIPTAPSQHHVEAPYNTLDHGLQQPAGGAAETG